jgi:3-hydroxybutyryl-CoA dehydratase
MFEIGQSWNHEWVISKTLVQNFLTLSKDYNPIHTSSSHAKSKGYEDKIVHGNILSCFISYFIGELLPLKDVVIIGQKIKYKNAFYINDVIKLNAIITKYSSSVKFAQFEFNFIKNDLQIASGNIQIKIL